jgi:glycosyltransferase involved in cell wall biosynthesis
VVLFAISAFCATFSLRQNSFSGCVKERHVWLRLRRVRLFVFNLLAMNAAAPLNLTILAAGAAGMYCGSCLRDNALAKALIRAGHNVSLIPLYTPLRTDEQDVSVKQVFYGGLNTWLQHAIGLIFRHTPRFIDRIFDSNAMLNFAGKLGANTSPAKLGPFTVSILKGHKGPQIKELRRLMNFLKTEIKPQIVTLPNAMFLGVAEYLRRELRVPIVCELTGEDIFLDAMIDPWKTQARDLMREHTQHVDRFIATSNYYAEKMAAYLALPRSRIETIYPGISKEHLSDTLPTRPVDRPPTVGYFARICPEKGLDRLVEGFKHLRTLEGMENAKLRAAGYLGKKDQRWFEDLKERIQHDSLADHFTYVGEVNLQGKLDFLDSVDILSVPTAYEEAKGIFILESLARGVPVVQPAHGSFRELIYTTGAGLLVPPNEPKHLAEALAKLLRESRLRQQLGLLGQAAIRSQFTDDHMAKHMMTLFEELLKWPPPSY